MGQSVPHMRRVAPKVLVETFELRDGVGVGVGLFRKRPHVGDFDEDLWVACEREQQIELVRAVERTVGHVVDNDDEVGVLLDEWDHIGHASHRREDGHRDFELSASSPERRHERAANPVAVSGGGGLRRTPWKPSTVGEAAEVVGRGGVLRVDAADAVKGAWVTFEDAGEIAIVPAVVNDLDEDGAENVVGLHEFEELIDGGVFGGWMWRRLRRETQGRASRRERASR